MKVSKKMTFNEYWSNPSYRDKKPVRNGSRKMLVGDNIYSYKEGQWIQADSHHSNADGSPNPHNVKNDTRSDAVLVSNHFYYFGSSAVLVPPALLAAVGYKNGRHHRVFSLAVAEPVLSFIERAGRLNVVAADPYDFNVANARYSVHKNKVIKAPRAAQTAAGQ